MKNYSIKALHGNISWSLTWGFFFYTYLLISFNDKSQIDPFATWYWLDLLESSYKSNIMFTMSLIEHIAQDRSEKSQFGVCTSLCIGDI